MEPNNELKNICRTCLTEKGIFYSVFLIMSNSGLSLDISEMINACGILKVTLEDGLPDQICSQCAEIIVKMYLFKLKCKKSDMILRERKKNYPLIFKQNFLKKGHKEKPLFLPEIKAESVDYTLNEIFVEDLASFEYEESKSITSLEDQNKEIPEQNKEIICWKNLAKKQCSKIKEFACDICQKKFTKEEILTNHKIAHTTKMNKLEIKYEDTFQENHNSISPLVIRSGESIFSCPDCEFIFLQKENLDNHICSLHGKQYSEVSFNEDLDDNDAGLFKARSSFVYPVSDQCITTSSFITEHQSFHSGEKPYKCNICKKKFSSYNTLWKHNIIHTGGKPYECDICVKKYSDSANLSRHKRTHMEKKPYECDICNKVLSSINSLWRHKKIHTSGKPYECGICKVKFSRMESLAEHKRNHTGQNPYECYVCKKKFSRPAKLVSHQRTHTGEKPFQCDVCQRTFSDLGNLRRHKKTHRRKSSSETEDEIFK